MNVRQHRSGLRMLRRGSAAIALVVAATVVSGCAGLAGGPVSVALSESAGYPADAPVPDPITTGGDLSPFGWLSEDRATITIITYGSSSCPFIGTAIRAASEALVEIEFEQARAEACTDDLGSRTHVFAAPDGLREGEVEAELSIAATAFGDVEPVVTRVILWPVPTTGDTIALETIRGVPDDITLPDGALDAGTPLAYWGEGRATLRVITWGSSSCPPPALALDVVNPTELALVFGALPPIACTADFAPTTHVLETPEGVGDGAVTLDITIEQREAESLQYVVPIAD